MRKYEWHEKQFNASILGKCFSFDPNTCRFMQVTTLAYPLLIYKDYYSKMWLFKIVLTDEKNVDV